MLTSSNRITLKTFPDTLDPKIPSQHDELLQRLKPFTIISTMRERTPFPRSTLEQLPNLKLLLTTGHRNAAIDAKACQDLGIAYSGTGLPADKAKIAAMSTSTNEHAWALLLGIAKNIASDDAVVKNGGWQSDLAFGLGGKTLGLLGLGRLGVQAAVTAKLGFAMDIICWSANLTQA